MSRDLNKVANETANFKVSTLRDQDNQCRLAGCRGGNVHAVLDVQIRENEKQEPTRFKQGDLIINAVDNQLMFYRIDEQLVAHKMTVA